MCGIAGAIGWIDPQTIDATERMSHALEHRGPDDQGAWNSLDGSPGPGAAFAFRRLAIIDLSADAHQPMLDPETGNVIVFNGEIYNYRLLRRELEGQGFEFRSKSDTEVIVKAYARWGVAALGRLRGMFALCIWDARRRHAIIARDRLGIKPLYVSTIDRAGDRSTVLFASELRALLASELVDRRLNPIALSSYIWNGFVVGPETIVEGIRLLPAGSFAIIPAATSRFELERFWELPAQTDRPHRMKGLADRDAVERLKDELETAVAQHLVSDVPLGVFLSGGIDSSAVAALAVRALARGNGSASGGVRTFNIAFDEAEYDESAHARNVAAALGTNHVEVRLDEQAFQAGLNDALESIDQPTFDAINTYFISRAVRQAGITVALAGTGGDEIFGGYKSFVDVPRAARVGRQLKMVPESMLRLGAGAVARLKAGAFGDVPPQTRWGKLGDGLATRGKLIDLYQTSYGLFTRSFMRELLVDGIHPRTRSGLPRSRARELSRTLNGRADLHAISMMELSCFIGERLLRDTDAASMAVSLEARVPLLDHAVIEAAAGVAPERRFKPLGRKSLLRELALGDLDPALFDRPKSGFVLPLDSWCRRGLHGELDAAFNDPAQCAAVGLNQQAVARLWRSFNADAPGLYWSRIWSLFALLWWCRRHRVAL